MNTLSLGGRVVLWVLTASLVACGGTPLAEPARTEPPSSGLLQAEPWPEADALFRSEPKWLGSDDAYSVDLGNGRTLWLFGDSFVSRSFLNTRRLSTMIRNSVGLQTGSDSANASMAFYWRTDGGRPSSYFPEDGETWFWPGHGVALGGKLPIFLMATRSTQAGIGFEHVGWRAVSVSNPEQAPSEWRLTWLETPENPFGLIVSGGVLQLGEYVYAFAAKEPEHTIHVVRWPMAGVLAEDLGQPQWWTGEEEGWVSEQDLVEAPRVLFAEGHTEFTVHYEPMLGRYLEIQTVGFGKADVGFRLADAPVGRWSPLEPFYRSEEYELSVVLIYAAKAHPQLVGADLVLTYATNIVGYGRLVARDDLYHPRFLRARFKAEPEEGSP